ncbi:hypothetical protein ACFX13_029200 [Malus domestica]
MKLAQQGESSSTLKTRPQHILLELHLDPSIPCLSKRHLTIPINAQVARYFLRNHCQGQTTRVHLPMMKKDGRW